MTAGALLFSIATTDITSVVIIVVSPFIGSFLGVLIRRLPENRPIAISRSKCDYCDTILEPRDLIPVFSFICLRGRCRRCEGAISKFYPAVEFAALGIAIASIVLSPLDRVVMNCCLGWVLLALAWIDIRTFLLPDILTLPLIIVGLAQAWLLQHDMVQAVLGAISGYGFIWLLAIAYRFLRGREGIGLGDAKLLAAAGAWLGWQNLPLVVLAASSSALVIVVIGSILGRSIDRETAVPFGPYLALAMWGVKLLDTV